MAETALVTIATDMAHEVEGATSSGLELKVQNPAFTSNDDQLDPIVAYSIALSNYSAEISAGAFEEAYATAQKMKDIFYGMPVVEWDMIRKVDVLSEYARKRAAIPTSRISFPDGCSPRDLVRLDITADHAQATLRQESERLFGTLDIKEGSGRMRSFMTFLADKKYDHAQSVVDDCHFDPAFKDYLKAEIHRDYH